MGELGDEVHLHDALIGFFVCTYEGAVCAYELAALYRTHRMTEWGRAFTCGLRGGEGVMSEHVFGSEIPVGEFALVECVSGEAFDSVSIFLFGEVVETWERGEAESAVGDGIFF